MAVWVGLAPLYFMKRGLFMIATTLLLLMLVALDRLSKVLLPVLLSNGQTITLIDGIVELRLLEGGNTGAAFGMLKNGTLVLIILTSLLMLVLVYLLFFKRFSSRWLYSAILLITAGGMGNLYDRVIYGYVTDFINFTFIEFPIFNIADCYVCIGAAILILWLILSGKDSDIFVDTDKSSHSRV